MQYSVCFLNWNSALHCTLTGYNLIFGKKDTLAHIHKPNHKHIGGYVKRKWNLVQKWLSLLKSAFELVLFIYQCNSKAIEPSWLWLECDDDRHNEMIPHQVRAIFYLAPNAFFFGRFHFVDDIRWLNGITRPTASIFIVVKLQNKHVFCVDFWYIYLNKRI